MKTSPLRCYLLAATIVSSLSITTNSLADTHTDTGSILLEPLEERRVKHFKNGNVLVNFHQKGVVISETSSSPWHNTAYFSQGSILKDKESRIIAAVALCQTIDGDGDLTWSTIWRQDDGTYESAIKAGTGKWKGITGSGMVTGIEVIRTDTRSQPTYEIQWEIANLPPAAGRSKPEDYQFHDRGLSFHGPHIYDFETVLKNGVTLQVSSQSGVLLSDNKAAKSPRNFATCYDRGTTYKPAAGTKGGSNGDAMLLEDTDPDGDIVWLYHEWWYSNPPGSYEFIGGTGKWQGITGYGVTRGMLRSRTDDHYMLKSEMHWNLE